jgi:hypothetical protein
MKTANILGSILGIAFSVFATNSLKPTSLAAFILIATWTSAPFIFALILSLIHQNKKGISVGIFLLLLVDLIFFIDIRYWHPDAQGGIAFMGLPFIGAIVIAISINVVKTRNPFDEVAATRRK